MPSIFFTLLCSFPLPCFVPPAMLLPPDVPASSAHLLSQQGTSSCVPVTTAQLATQLHMSECCGSWLHLETCRRIHVCATMTAFSCWRYSNIIVFGETAQLQGTANPRDVRWQFRLRYTEHISKLHVTELSKVAQAFSCKETTDLRQTAAHLGMVHRPYCSQTE